MPIIIFTLITLLGYSIGLHADEDRTYDIVITGGGISGMTAAYYAKDYDIKVLEKRSAVGGRAFSLPHKGFVYACGAEYLGKLYGPLKKITRELKLTVREIPYPMDVYFDNGSFYYGEMGRALLADKKTGLAAFKKFAGTIQKTYKAYADVPELDMNSPIARLDTISAYDWFKENQFPDFFIKKYNATFKGLFGANIHDISALSSLTEIAFDYENVNLENEFSDPEDLENDDTPGKYKTSAFSFDAGIAEIPRAVAARLGDKVMVNAHVTQIEKKEDLFLTTFRNTAGKHYTLRSDSVILATPAPVTLEIAGQVLSPEQRQILAQVEYAPFITLALYSSVPIFTKGFDLAVPDNMFFTDIYDATWIPRFYNNELKNLNTYITTVYIAPATYRDRSILDLSDKEILSRTYSDMEKIFPGVKYKIEGHKIFRFKYGYPVMSKGAYRRLTRLHSITRAPLTLAGDYMIYPTLEAAADSGVMAAEKTMEWLEEPDDDEE